MQLWEHGSGFTKTSGWSDAASDRAFTKTLNSWASATAAERTDRIIFQFNLH
jgi:hypothetical protein